MSQVLSGGHSLTRRLIEQESRYRCREPRPEDVQAIQELQRVVREQEVQMKEMAVSAGRGHSSTLGSCDPRTCSQRRGSTSWSW